MFIFTKEWLPQSLSSSQFDGIGTSVLDFLFSTIALNASRLSRPDRMV